MKRKSLFLGLILFLIIFGIIFATFGKSLFSNSKSNLRDKFDYRLVFVGDSMTEYLGNFDELSGYLNKYYPNKNFLLLNYGFSSTNILSVPDRITQSSTHSGRVFQAINDIPFNYIFIESFGNNPLSEYPQEVGLKKQTEALDQIVSLITKKHPKSSIIFIATIAPNKERYGEGAVNLQPEQRKQWADERIAYIQNHINYAKSHNIPVINIFADSLDSKGDGKIDYLNTNDFIHPSPTGVFFISGKIAKFIFQNHLL